MPMAKRDYYDILGVSRTASADEIKKAHRRLVRQYHPDANKGDPRAEERFKEIQEAYDVLSDTQKRAAYDQFGHAGPEAAAAGVDPFEAFRQARGAQAGGRRAWAGGPGVSVEDIDFGSPSDISELFERMFGNFRAGGQRTAGRARPSTPPPSADIEHGVTLSFEQAARGTSLPLQINRDGRIETIDVKIPAGVKDGSRIRVRGQGGNVGGHRGDLFIITRVAPHPVFRREDLDVHMDLPISLYEALKGAKVEVPTLDGPVTVAIPPGTSSGAKLRIRGRGIERAGQRGDQYVIPRIIVPRELDAEDLKLVDQLAKRRPVRARG
jgi:curved DNA-binding protein